MRAPSAPPRDSRFERVVGSYTVGVPGPMIIVLGGIHGNEPGGVHAQRRVLARLQRERLPLAGKIVGLTGNLGALQDGQRYTSRDLNRKWSAEQLAVLAGRDPAFDDAEDREQRALLQCFEQCLAEAAGPVLALDLHTSSAPGSPFCCLGDTMPNRRIAMALEIPVILGLEETIDGAVLDYFSERGLAGIAVEGGQHESEQAVDCLEAAIWLTLIASGALPESSVADVESMRQRLRDASRGAPPVVEIRYHRKITGDEEFEMAPGFESFQAVQLGQVLARDRDGEVRANESGRVLLPLYQGLGEDGFFLCRDVKPFWLGVARWLRMLRFGSVLPLLPGVRRVRDRDGALSVDPRVARWLVREIFHLLGYRRCRPEGDRLVFSRRRVAPMTERLPWTAAG